MISVKEIAEVLNAKVICGVERINENIAVAFASDLMSDVLTLDTENMLLVTGLCNMQVIRTAEMSDISFILFVRGKQINEDMYKLAKENEMIILECEYSMYRTCGELFKMGVDPVY